MTDAPHPVGQRVRTIFDHERSSREGVVIASEGRRGGKFAILIEFEDWDEDEERPFTHRKWLPSHHWVPISRATGEDSPANEGEA